MTEKSAALTSKSFHHAAIERPTTTQLNDNDLANERSLIAKGEAKVAAAAQAGNPLPPHDVRLAAYVYNMIG